MDFIRPFVFHSQQTHVVTILDHFSKFAYVVVALTNSDAIWKVCDKQWVAWIECHEQILIDSVSYFTLKFFFEKKCGSIGIKSLYAFPSHLKGNGVVKMFYHFMERNSTAYTMQTSQSLEEVLAIV